MNVKQRRQPSFHPCLDAQTGSLEGMLATDCRCAQQRSLSAEIKRSSLEAGPISTPLPISCFLFLMAMRHCTDVPCADLSQTLCIEIGGAMTADTPPQQIKEAA